MHKVSAKDISRRSEGSIECHLCDEGQREVLCRVDKQWKVVEMSTEETSGQNKGS